jgi:hypothetical protein
MLTVADLYNANRLKEFCEWFRRNNQELMLLAGDEQELLSYEDELAFEQADD